MRLTDFHKKFLAASLLALPLSITACGDDVTGGDSGDDSTGGTTEDPTDPTNPTTLTTTTNPTSSTTDPTAADSSSSGDPTTETDTTPDTDTTTTTDPGTSSSTSEGDESSSSTTGTPAECGDGVLNGDEECDTDDFGDAACPVAGDLLCNDDCTIDNSGCTDTLVVCNTPAAPIDGTTTPAAPLLDVANIADDFFVTDLNVTVDITHTWVGDLVGGVVSPDPAAQSVLFAAQCDAQFSEDLDARFDDEGVAPECMPMVIPTLSGDITPLTELRDLIGISSAGDWTFVAWDEFPGSDDGTLNEWCLEFTLSDTDPVVCGDDVANYGEACDGADLNGAIDCTSLPGFISGDIACADDCSFDTSGCVAACGNGDIDDAFGEVCDGDNLDGLTCDDLPGFSGGTLACAADCGSFDTSMCDATCGNDMVDDPTEECDGADLNGLTCDDFFGLSGPGLACDAMCGFDFTGCMDSGAFEVCSTPAAVIDNTLPPAVDTLNVADMGNVADLNVRVDISHTWVGDVDISIDSPTGTSALVLDNGGPCGNVDDLVGVFDDEGAAIDCGTSPIVGNIIPAPDVLTAFDGEDFNGDWTITVTDSVGGDNGTLNEWCVQITPEP